MPCSRLVLVTRQFWPLVGGAQVVLAGLAGALAERGMQVTVLTARWRPDWPDRIDHRGATVVRLPQPHVRWWGTWRYMRAVAAWLRAHRGAYDLVYVSMLKHDAWASLGAVDRARTPVVLRVEGAGTPGDVAWSRGACCGSRIAARCRQATAVVAPGEAARAELLGAGYDTSQIVSIANGTPIPPDAAHRSREEARRALAAADRRLALPDSAPLALFTGRLDADKGLDTLVAAWPDVVTRRPEARLWLVGDGPERDGLRARIHAARLDDRITLVGRVDSVADYLAAADLFLLPSRHELMSVSLLEAMAARVPVVASDIRGNRALIDDGRHGLLAPPDDPRRWGDAVIEVLDDPRSRGARVAEARERVAREFSLAAMVERHEELFNRLVDELRVDEQRVEGRSVDGRPVNGSPGAGPR